MSNLYTQKPSKSDLLAVLLSSTAGIIQLLILLTGSFDQHTIFGDLLIEKNLTPLLILLSVISSLCLMGAFSFFRKNPGFASKQTSFKPLIWIKEKLFISHQEESLPDFRRNEKRTLILSVVLLLISLMIFSIATIEYKLNLHIIFNQETLPLWQLVSFLLLWVVIPVILFIWINNEIEKQRQFKPEDFIPNLINALRSQGYIQIKISSDIQMNNFHLVKGVINDNNPKYFVVQFDGNKIIEEITEEKFSLLINGK